ncbi:type II asparaginase [Myroides odoratimimus]|uniref:L-asparaginase n=3 Tax=Myroides odoratimimus TaxID=76832 RepID=A0A0S7ECW4_9FLAO|nr:MULTISPECIES: type II asparaginase [Myroides]AJA67567.1 L-asparaginase, type II [Myroides sp. A21]ALU24871.1 L-asparaginase [Myroides odoratimimus]EHO06006.1 L-asparaginase, type II [Myroides odoratimimus CCUG 10230]EHO06565.1 L-asparaginase, type II [Myroides odoratimimus CIP 101113]EHO06597.1 L-asparaginase, type II [Myroides odoratimimus CCUG 12901]
MKKVFSLMFGVLLAFQMQAQTKGASNTSKDEPRVIILATGGTIAGSGESATKAAYTAGKIPIENLLNAVPEMHKFGKVKGEQIAQIGSQDMNIETWLKLSNRINEIFEKDEADGVVITHGTDTQEETAYFLELTINSNKPVVLVGAMRPATAMSQDGNRNLLDAVMVAASPESKEAGVVIAMNEAVFAARDVTKTVTTNMATFQSRNFGPIGLIFDGKVSYYYKTLRSPEKKFNVKGLTKLPQVEIVYGYADASPRAVTAAKEEGVAGIVYAGMGNGNFNAPVGDALIAAAKSGIIVCRSARAGAGRVTLFNEVDDNALGFVVADDLSPQKARILLMLALTETKDRAVIQDMFFKY